MKILFLVSGNINVASSRTRVYQYLPHLQKRNISYKVIPFSTEHNITQKKGNLFLLIKSLFFVFCAKPLIYIYLLFIVKRYDILFVQKILFPVWYFNFLHFFNDNIYFDMDDAIYSNHSLTRKKNRILRLTNILTKSRRVSVENMYTKKFVEKYNTNIKIITGPIDTDRYKPSLNKTNHPICIGWIGNSTTSELYLTTLFTVFERVSKIYPTVIFKFIGAKSFPNQKFNIIQVDWSLDTEIEELAAFDIGIMPLVDSDWARGKGGYKILQYMAMGIPVVASPVGINKELISNNINGFLAESDDDWFRNLSILINDASLRNIMGKKNRSAADKYSLANSNIV